MKKSIFAIAALAMGMTFAACGNSSKSGDADNAQDANQEQQAEQKEEAPAAEEETTKEDVAEFQVPEAPNVEGLSEEEAAKVMAEYNAQVAALKAGYEAQKQAAAEKLEEAEAAVESVQEKMEEGKQTVEQVKQDAENLKNAAEQLGSSVRGIK